MKNLINNDISRCNDYACPTNAYCARFKQLHIDKENSNGIVSVTNFMGCEKKGLCDNFLNSDIIKNE